MNKIVNINLGGYPFTIDEDAYEQLNDYLQTIHHHFRLSEGYEEITADIENRMAELFQEKLAGRPIVTQDEVRGVVAIMGTPEDFGAEPMSEEAPKSSAGKGVPSWKKWKIKTGKRLFSNPEDKVIGGVCSGIAAYFGIQDPLWVRLIFVVFAITGGFAIPFYFILWAILPKASSASDRLAMRGEPANVNNIGKIIEEEFDHVSKKVSELGGEIEAKFNTKKKSGGNQSSFDEFRKDFKEDWNKSGGGQALRSAASEGISILGKVVMAVLQILKAILKPVLFALGIAMVILLALSWFGAVAALSFGYPFSSFLHPDASFLTVIGVVNVLMVLGIPLVMLILFIMRVFLRTHFKPRYAVGLWIFWAVNVFSLISIIASNMHQFSAGGQVSLGTTDLPTNADTLVIEMAKNPYEETLLQFGDGLFITDDQLVSRQIVLNFEKSKTGKFEIVRQHNARGSTMSEAQQLASDIQYEYSMEGNKLLLPSHFIVPKGKKWRVQEVELTLRIPEGKWVKRQGGDRWNFHHIETDENHAFPWWGDKYAWQMTANGMIAPDYIKENEKDYSSFKDFTKIRVEGNVELRVQQGENYEVKLISEKEYERELGIRQSGNTLIISAPEHFHSTFTMEITMPSLEEYESKNSHSEAWLKDFKLKNLRIIQEGEGDIKADLQADSLQVQLTGGSKIRLTGEGGYLKAILEGSAAFDAEHFKVRVADVGATDNSWLKISAADTLRQSIDESSSIEAKGKPVVINN